MTSEPARRKLAVELLDRPGMLEDYLRHVGTGRDVTPLFEFEQVAFGADDGTFRQALKETLAGA